MSGSYHPPAPDSYRLLPGVRVVQQGQGGMAICAYPLRIVRLGSAAARLLELCQEEHTTAELAAQLSMPIGRTRALCEQLRWKGLLDAGPMVHPATWPGISIIIPSYNRAAQLERCLRSLLALHYPLDRLEIIVVDDASTDATAAMLKHFAREAEAGAVELRIIHHHKRQGVAKARNTGADAAHHDLLAYIDSDCVASPEWLSKLTPAFQDQNVAAVGGMIRAYERASVLGRYEDARSSLNMGKRVQQGSLNGPLTYLPTANLLVRRAAWRQIGGFAPLTFGEDVDFCHRLLSNSRGILYLPRGVVYHDYRTTFWEFLRIRASYASAEATLQRLHPEQRRILVLPPEQAAFAALAIGGLYPVGARFIAPNLANHTINHNKTDPMRGRVKGRNQLRPYMVVFAVILTLCGAFKRWRTVRVQGVPIGPLMVLRATLRGHLAYTYHLCRHLTRYYTLPLLVVGLALPPLLLLAMLLFIIVIGVDYARLRPDMGMGAYAFCSLLDDCAYEVGVVWGCIRQRTWKPLLPVIRQRPVSGRLPTKEQHQTYPHPGTRTAR